MTVNEKLNELFPGVTFVLVDDYEDPLEDWSLYINDMKSEIYVDRALVFEQEYAEAEFHVYIEDIKYFLKNKSLL